MISEEKTSVVNASLEKLDFFGRQLTKSLTGHACWSSWRAGVQNRRNVKHNVCSTSVTGKSECYEVKKPYPAKSSNNLWFETHVVSVLCENGWKGKVMGRDNGQRKD